MGMRRYVLAIIGGGPSCTYVIERLAAMMRAAAISPLLDIEIFDRTGEFGAGEVHSSAQPTSSFLNRIAGQVAFAADETNEGENILLPQELRPTLHEWCRKRFDATGHGDFDLSPEDWPKRYVHGLALSDMFERYVTILRDTPGLEVQLHHASVEDIERGADGRFTILTDRRQEQPVRADHILFVTGHSRNDPMKSPDSAQLVALAKNVPNLVYVPYAYPLERQIREQDTTPQSVVALLGLGLTAIDVILYLTETRGGRFLSRNGSEQLVYVPAGREPRSIVAFGNSGLFTFARPYNAKEKDIARLEHKAVFLTSQAIARLRESQGHPCTVSPIGLTRQINFDRHIFPLIILEMAYLYYATLYGPSFALNTRQQEADVYETFLLLGAGERDAAIERLLKPIQQCAEGAERIIDAALNGRPLTGTPRGLDAFEVVVRYVGTVFGEHIADSVSAVVDEPERLAGILSQSQSPWRHPREPEAHRFNWRKFIEPIPVAACASGALFTAAVIDFMEWDHLQAAQDNVRNPFKAACDGVWRDLRPVIAEAVDFGGLDAESHRRFLEVHIHQHNRLANGAGLSPMQKMLALIRAGILDISIGPRPQIEVDLSNRCFRISGQITGEVREASTLIDGKLHPFNPDRDAFPLYRNLLRRDLIRKWRNPGSDGKPGFEPGGLDLSRDFHPIRPDGTVDASLTFLGPPTEGVMFFQLGAARPNSNHHVLNDIIRWTKIFGKKLDQMQEHASVDPLSSG
jgi:FAD-NAD(P)-binding